MTASKPEVVARILTWAGPRHAPVPFDGLCARTFNEFPLENEHHGYWKESEPLIRLTDHEADRVVDKARIAELTDLCDRLKQEAQIHAQEARTANATIAEIYRIVSGGKGEPGNWNGAEPVRKRIAELEAERKEVRDLLKAMFPKHVVKSLAALAQQGKDGET